MPFPQTNCKSKPQWKGMCGMNISLSSFNFCHIIICKVNNFTFLMCKGVVLLDKTQGFWLVHSTPHFPNATEAGKFEYPETGKKNGQNFICVTYPLDMFETIGKYMLWYIYILTLTVRVILFFFLTDTFSIVLLRTNYYNDSWKLVVLVSCATPLMELATQITGSVAIVIVKGTLVCCALMWLSLYVQNTCK